MTERGTRRVGATKTPSAGTKAPYSPGPPRQQTRSRAGAPPGIPAAAAPGSRSHFGSRCPTWLGTISLTQALGFTSSRCKRRRPAPVAPAAGRRTSRRRDEPGMHSGQRHQELPRSAVAPSATSCLLQTGPLTDSYGRLTSHYTPLTPRQIIAGDHGKHHDGDRWTRASNRTGACGSCAL